MMDQPTTHRTLVPDPPRAIPRWFFVRRMQAMVFLGPFLIGLSLLLGIGLPVLFYFLGDCVSPMADWDLDRDHALATAVITDKQIVSHTQVGSRHPQRHPLHVRAESVQPPEPRVGARDVRIGASSGPGGDVL